MGKFVFIPDSKERVFYKNHMTYKYLCMAAVTATVFISTSSLALAAQDRLFLKNGDRLSGEITSFNKNTVTIETGFGTLNVESANIGGVASPRYEMSDLAAQLLSPPLHRLPMT